MAFKLTVEVIRSFLVLSGSSLIQRFSDIGLDMFFNQWFKRLDPLCLQTAHANTAIKFFFLNIHLVVNWASFLFLFNRFKRCSDRYFHSFFDVLDWVLMLGLWSYAKKISRDLWFSQSKTPSLNCQIFHLHICRFSREFSYTLVALFLNVRCYLLIWIRVTALLWCARENMCRTNDTDCFRGSSSLSYRCLVFPLVIYHRDALFYSLFVCYHYWVL
jgi:hypothetical protein